MPFYTTPNVRTDEYTPELTPDPVAESLQRAMQAVTLLPADPIVQRTGGVLLPGVPWNYGWIASQTNTPQLEVFSPMQSPDIQYSTGSYPGGVSQAAQPKPTLATMGIHGPLRAPGINEGLT